MKLALLALFASWEFAFERRTEKAKEEEKNMTRVDQIGGNMLLEISIGRENYRWDSCLNTINHYREL